MFFFSCYCLALINHLLEWSSFNWHVIKFYFGAHNFRYAEYISWAAFLSISLNQGGGRKPWNSINFVCAHDGFTLADLVTYNDKHNLANGEDNNDGESHNNSWNCGQVDTYVHKYYNCCIWFAGCLVLHLCDKVTYMNALIWHWCKAYKVSVVFHLWMPQNWHGWLYAGP